MEWPDKQSFVNTGQNFGSAQYCKLDVKLGRAVEGSTLGTSCRNIEKGSVRHVGMFGRIELVHLHVGQKKISVDHAHHWRLQRLLRQLS